MLAAARYFGRKMVEQPQGGTLIFTSSSAAMRGSEGQQVWREFSPVSKHVQRTLVSKSHSLQGHASAMGGRRLLAMSLMQELGPKGVHGKSRAPLPHTVNCPIVPETFLVFKSVM